jgi:hypothetical protein
MKKVRLALGAAGVAPAALGLMMAPTANAATVSRRGPQAPTSSGVTPGVAHHCPESIGTHSRKAASGPLAGTMHYTGNCVTRVKAVLDFPQKGLVDRVRFRSVNGGLNNTTWVPGCILGIQFPPINSCNGDGSRTSFNSTPQFVAHQVCEAITLSANHNNVLYGPVCEFTS